MTRATRFILLGVAAIIALLIVAVASLPLFLNADSFRTRIEATLSKSLGRKVSIGKLDLSVWSGGMVAENTTIADDPKFSTQPFVQAQSVKIRVQMLPLIFHRTVLIKGFSLEAPKILLLRAANGVWNYSTIGNSAGKSAQDADTKATFPNLTVDKVDIVNGQITVGSASGNASAATTPNRVYDQVNLSVTDFGFANAFPFTASANLPAGGSLSITGKAGPINPQDASTTPFSSHLEMKHTDPLAAGFVDSSVGVSGQVDSIVLDAAWSGQQMHVAKLLVDSPHLTITRSATPAPPKPAGGGPNDTSMLKSLFVDEAKITNGTLTLVTAGQTGAPAVYQQLNAQVTNLTPTTASAFSASAQLPGGGRFAATGKAGPFNQQNNAATPLDAQVTLKHVELGSAGILPADAGIAGLADLQAQIQSDGQTLNAAGTTTVANIKLAKNGQPSPKPLQLQFKIAQNEQAMTGQIQQGTITIGRAVINLAGTYQTAGPTTALNIKVNGNAMPVDDLQAFLPAVGVTLPQGSRLQGGTLTTALTVSGSSASPVISGPVSLNNTQLAGFDLGSKLSSLSQLTGGKIGSATGPGTNIRSLSMNVQVANGNIRTDKVALDVTGVGTATGAGSVSAAGALNYNVLLKLTGLIAAGGGASGGAANAGSVAGLIGGLSGMIPGGAAAGSLGSLGNVAGAALRNGVPVAIGGTTSNPTFTPDLSRVAASAAQGMMKGGGKQSPAQSDPLGSALGGLFGGKH
jgi:AsmA protein